MGQYSEFSAPNANTPRTRVPKAPLPPPSQPASARSAPPARRNSPPVYEHAPESNCGKGQYQYATPRMQRLCHPRKHEHSHHEQNNRVDATQHRQLRTRILHIPLHEYRQQPRRGQNRQSDRHTAGHSKMQHAFQESWNITTRVRSQRKNECRHANRQSTHICDVARQIREWYLRQHHTQRNQCGIHGFHEE